MLVLGSPTLPIPSLDFELCDESRIWNSFSLIAAALRVRVANHVEALFTGRVAQIARLARVGNEAVDGNSCIIITITLPRPQPSLLYISRGTWSPSVRTSDSPDAGRDPNAAFHTINRSRWHNTGIFATVELTLTPSHPRSSVDESIPEATLARDRTLGIAFIPARLC